MHEIFFVGPYIIKSNLIVLVPFTLFVHTYDMGRCMVGWTNFIVILQFSKGPLLSQGLLLMLKTMP